MQCYLANYEKKYRLPAAQEWAWNKAEKAYRVAHAENGDLNHD